MRIVDRVDVALHPGEVACLLGPNGAGKSTLLRTLIGSQPPLEGRVLLDGVDLTNLTARQRAQRLSVVLTDRIDVGFLTGRALVQLGRTPHVGWFARLGGDDHDVVDRALAAAGATELAERMVHELSDGERQRMMIARALAQQPRLLVLDEPTAFLDVTRRVELVALLRRLAATTGLAVLMSTHELDLALRNADHAWLIDGDGRFDAGGPEDLALAGRLQAAFGSDDVGFDDCSGALVIGSAQDAQRPSIAVLGTPPTVWWAQRAVDRAGWRVDASATGVVTVNGTAWRLRLDHDRAAGHDLSSLVHALRERGATPSRTPNKEKNR